MKSRFLTSLAVSLFLQLLVLTSCQRNTQGTVLTPVPFLTDRTWLADTILPVPPVTFSQLTSTEQQQLLQANAFFKIATLRLKENGTVVTTNWDFGFIRWKLVNNKQDIEMEKGDGTRLVLRNWQANATNFLYTLTFSAYDVNYQFK